LLAALRVEGERGKRAESDRKVEFARERERESRFLGGVLARKKFAKVGSFSMEIFRNRKSLLPEESLFVRGLQMKENWED